MLPLISHESTLSYLYVHVLRMTDPIPQPIHFYANDTQNKCTFGITLPPY